MFLSSHILPEVERVCDRIGIIREGRLVTVETVVAIKGKALRQLEIVFPMTRRWTSSRICPVCAM